VQYEIELRACVLFSEGVLEFRRFLILPFMPIPGLVIHEGIYPNRGMNFTVTNVCWLAGEARFLVQLADDTDSAGLFGDDPQALRTEYENRGWEEVCCNPSSPCGAACLACAA
jgi:hypothetical protein